LISREDIEETLRELIEYGYTEEEAYDIIQEEKERQRRFLARKILDEPY